MPTTVVDLTSDALIYILSFLPPPDLLSLRKTCKLLRELTQQRIVWTNACTFHVIGNGFPFPSVDLSQLPLRKLISQTLHGFFLGLRWQNGLSSPIQVQYIDGTAGASVSAIKFLPGQQRRFLAAISKSIWFVLSIWDTSCNPPLQVCEWSPRGGIFSGFAVNTDGASEPALAISVQIGGEQSVKVLTLISNEKTYELVEMSSVDTPMNPVAFSGDLLALSDYHCQTTIWNWKQGTFGLLEHVIDEDEHVVGHDECLCVSFLHHSILVVRARSMHLFPYPTFSSHPSTPHRPLARHSFGWIDGVSVAECPRLIGSKQSGTSNTVFVLVRGESDDPWDSHRHNLELYVLHPNPEYDLYTSADPFLQAQSTPSPPSSPTSPGIPSSINVPPQPPPYIFPPRLHAKVQSRRGALRCTQIVLGSLGSALFVEPQQRSTYGLIPFTQDVSIDAATRAGRINERLLTVAFPGSLSRVVRNRAAMVQGSDASDGGDGSASGGTVVEVGSKLIFENTLNNWTALDYDEDLGRVAFGTGFGKVTILQL